MATRSKSSQRWLKEHFSDPFVKKAQAEGMRSRAAYKLEELIERDRLLKPGGRLFLREGHPMLWALGDPRPDGLLTVEGDRHLELTEEGRGLALEMIRHHRLLELYLQKALGFTWDKVDAEAERRGAVLARDLLGDLRGSRVQIRVPQRGDKKALFDTVGRNASEALAQQAARQSVELLYKPITPETLARVAYKFLNI